MNEFEKWVVSEYKKIADYVVLFDSKDVARRDTLKEVLEQYRLYAAKTLSETI